MSSIEIWKTAGTAFLVLGIVLIVSAVHQFYENNLYRFMMLKRNARMVAAGRPVQTKSGSPPEDKRAQEKEPDEEPDDLQDRSEDLSMYEFEDDDGSDSTGKLDDDGSDSTGKLDEDGSDSTGKLDGYEEPRNDDGDEDGSAETGILESGSGETERLDEDGAAVTGELEKDSAAPKEAADPGTTYLSASMRQAIGSMDDGSLWMRPSKGFYIKKSAVIIHTYKTITEDGKEDTAYAASEEGDIL
jgi:hypothetical protein